jgi:hypothetical protein
MGNMGPESVLEMANQKGWKVVGFVYFDPKNSETGIIWNLAIPMEVRRSILENELVNDSQPEPLKAE